MIAATHKCYTLAMGHHRRALTLAVLAAVHAGCPCPTLEEAQVWDRFDQATPEQVLGIQHSIEDFATWTGVSDLCVQGVQIRPILWPDAAGMYQGDGEWILVESGPQMHAAGVVRHELCHAWDAYQGWPSVDTPEVFPPSDIDKVFNYWSDDARSQESFAETCGRGPYDVGISLGLEQACGLDLLTPRERWVTENVFVSFPLTWAYDGELELTKTVVPLPYHDWYIDFVTDGERLVAFVADAAELPYDTLWLGTPPSDHGGGATTDYPPSTSFRVVTIDPASGDELTSMDVIELIRGSNHGITLLAGGTEPLLVGVSDDATHGWRIDPRAGTARKVGLPRLLSSPMAGLARDDTAWLVASTAENFYYGLREVDLTTGHSTEVTDGDDALLEYHSNSNAAPMTEWGDNLLIGVSDGTQVELIEIDPERDIVHRLLVSDREWTFLTKLAPLPDGRLLAELVMVFDPYDTNFDFRTFMLVLDLENNTWQLDPDTCTDAWVQQLGYDGAGELLSIGDQTYTIMGSWDEQDRPTRSLVRLGVPD